MAAAAHLTEQVGPHAVLDLQVRVTGKKGSARSRLLSRGSRGRSTVRLPDVTRQQGGMCCRPQVQNSFQHRVRQSVMRSSCPSAGVAARTRRLLRSAPAAACGPCSTRAFHRLYQRSLRGAGQRNQFQHMHNRPAPGHAAELETLPTKQLGSRCAQHTPSRLTL